MKNTFDQIAFWKNADIIFQCIAFCVAMAAMALSPLSVFALYMIGLAQFISSVAWLIVWLTKDIQQVSGACSLRVVMIMVISFLAFLYMLDGTLFLMASCVMLVVGPFLGIYYFITTIEEHKFYANARKPYYLL